MARPAFEQTRYFPPVVVGDRQADLTLSPEVAKLREGPGIRLGILATRHNGMYMELVWAVSHDCRGVAVVQPVASGGRLRTPDSRG